MAFAIVPTDFTPRNNRRILVGIDTGATNTRFEGRKFVTLRDDSVVSEENVFSGKVKTNDYSTYPDLLSAVIERAGKENKNKIAGVASGIPGPFNKVSGDISNSNAQNLRHINVYEVSNFLKSLGIDAFAYLNDLEATTWGLSSNGMSLITDDLNPTATHNDTTSRFAVMAQGTGLGQGFGRINDENKIEIWSSEGGHTDLPTLPKDEDTIYLKRYLAAKHNRIPETEDVLSGFGIVDTYLFVTGKEKLPEELASKEDKAGEIFRKALEGNSACKKTMELFVKIYGAQARNFVFVNVADTVFLAGNAYSQRELLKNNSLFIDAFKKDTRFEKEILDNVRVGIVNPDGLGEQGGINYLKDLFQAREI